MLGPVVSSMMNVAIEEVLLPASSVAVKVTVADPVRAQGPAKHAAGAYNPSSTLPPAKFRLKSFNAARTWFGVYALLHAPTTSSAMAMMSLTDMPTKSPAVATRSPKRRLDELKPASVASNWALSLAVRIWLTKALFQQEGSEDAVGFGPLCDRTKSSASPVHGR